MSNFKPFSTEGSIAGCTGLYYYFSARRTLQDIECIEIEGNYIKRVYELYNALQNMQINQRVWNLKLKRILVTLFREFYD